MLFHARSAVESVFVNVANLRDTFTSSLIPALVKAYDDSSITIKGLLLTNPHNPLGQCYPRSVLEECLKFCQERKIHFISDEVHALSSFQAWDLPDAVPFTSALQLDATSLGCDLSRVHTVWSISKDLGSSSLRMVGF